MRTVDLVDFIQAALTDDTTLCRLNFNVLPKVENRKTTTGSEQLHVVLDGKAFNVTITKARG